MPKHIIVISDVSASTESMSNNFIFTNFVGWRSRKILVLVLMIFSSALSALRPIPHSLPLANRPNTLSVQIGPGACQSSIQWVPGDLFPEEKWPVRESNDSPTSRTEIKNSWRYNSIPHTHLRLGVQLCTGKYLLCALPMNNFFPSCNLQLWFRGKAYS
jgi:hypothetical protein